MTMDSMKRFQEETRETVKYDQGASDLAIAMHGSPLDLEHFLVLTYVASKMAGEAGEVAQELGKYVRGDFGEKELHDKLAKETRDVLWYVARMFDELHLDMGAEAAKLLDHLQDRKQRGVIHGSGDDR